MYITVYLGNRLPPLYIGSSSVNRINKGYRGTVKSKKYKSAWNEELIANSDLFFTYVVNTFATRKEATVEELRLQVKYDVVKSPFFVNEAFATVNGFFTMTKSGKDNPMFGRKHSVESRKKMSENAINRDVSGSNNPMFGKPGPKSMLGRNHSVESRQKMRGKRDAVGGANNAMFGLVGEKHPAFGFKHSQDFINKQKIQKPQITCPHCGKVGGKPVMMRFHFDKCKLIT